MLDGGGACCVVIQRAFEHAGVLLTQTEVPLDAIKEALKIGREKQMRTIFHWATQDDAKGEQLAVFSTNRKDDKKGPACGCEVM